EEDGEEEAERGGKLLAGTLLEQEVGKPHPGPDHVGQGDHSGDEDDEADGGPVALVGTEPREKAVRVERGSLPGLPKGLEKPYLASLPGRGFERRRCFAARGGGGRRLAAGPHPRLLRGNGRGLLPRAERRKPLPLLRLRWRDRGLRRLFRQLQFRPAVGAVLAAAVAGLEAFSTPRAFRQHRP